MATTNNITGDLIKSRNNSDKYAANYDAIFKKKQETQKKDTDSVKPVSPVSSSNKANP